MSRSFGDELAESRAIPDLATCAPSDTLEADESNLPAADERPVLPASPVRLCKERRRAEGQNGGRRRPGRRVLLGPTHDYALYIYMPSGEKKRRRAGTRILLHIRALDGRGQPGGGKIPSSFRSFCGLSTTTAVFRITGFVRGVFAGHNIHTSERGRGAVDRFSLEIRTPRRGAP